MKWTLYTLAGLLLASIGYRLIRHYLETRGGAQIRFGNTDVADFWQEAERAASQGNHTEAAHLLYAALVRMLMLRGVLRFHSSKTTGDYARELRGRGGPLVAPWTAFISVYELVVYRDGVCDAARYAALRSLAEPLVRPERAAA